MEFGSYTGSVLLTVAAATLLSNFIILTQLNKFIIIIIIKGLSCRQYYHRQH